MLVKRVIEIRRGWILTTRIRLTDASVLFQTDTGRVTMFMERIGHVIQNVMDRDDVQRCLLRVAKIKESDLEQFGSKHILVHATPQFKEELMRRKNCKPEELVTVKRFSLEGDRENAIKAFVNEVTVLKVLSGQEGFPCLYGVTSHLNVTLPAIVKGFIGNPSVARYLILSEPIKLCQNSMLPLAKDADWICVSLFISRIIERLHLHGFTLGNTQEEQFALDINRLDSGESGQLSAFLLDFSFIEPMPSQAHDSHGSRSPAKEVDIASFGKMIFTIGWARKVPVLKALGEMCMNKDPKKRPLLAEIIKCIEKSYALQVLNGAIT